MHPGCRKFGNSIISNADGALGEETSPKKTCPPPPTHQRKSLAIVTSYSQCVKWYHTKQQAKNRQHFEIILGLKQKKTDSFIRNIKNIRLQY